MMGNLLISNEIYDFFHEQKILLRDLRKINLGKKRNILIFTGTDINNFYNFIVINKSKTKILSKNITEIEENLIDIEKQNSINIKKKKFFYIANICKKALNELKILGFKCKNLDKI